MGCRNCWMCWHGGSKQWNADQQELGLSLFCNYQCPGGKRKRSGSREVSWKTLSCDGSPIFLVFCSCCFLSVGTGYDDVMMSVLAGLGSHGRSNLSKLHCDQESEWLARWFNPKKTVKKLWNNPSCNHHSNIQLYAKSLSVYLGISYFLHPNRVLCLFSGKAVRA